LRYPDAGVQFGTPTLTHVADGVAELVAADFNGDGKQDLVVSMGDPNVGSGLIAFLAGKGDGAFAPPLLLWTGPSPRGVAALDIDGDGLPDIAVGVCADGGNWVSYFLRTDGGFGARHDIAVQNCPYALAAVDLNGDGRTDLVTASPGPYLTEDGGGGELDIFLSSHGSLSLWGSLDTPAGASGLATPDLNRDGFPDLVATTTAYDPDSGVVDAELQVWLNVDGGMMYPHVASVVLDHGGYRAVAAGDLDRDGLVDLALISAHSGTLAVLLGKGDGTFQAPSYSGVSGNPSALGVADFRQVGLLDVAVSLSGIFPFLGMSVFSGGAPDPMPLNDEVRVLSDASSAGLAIADFTGDGIPDVALTLYDFGSVAIIPGLSGPPILPDPLTYKPAPHVPVAPLAYNGGPTVATPHVVTIHYQDDTNASVFEAFDDWLVNSQWLASIGKDYGVGLGTNENVMIARSAPASLQDSDIRTLINELILDGGVPPPSVRDGGLVPEQIYFLYLPFTTTVNAPGVGRSCHDYGGYHSENDLGPIHFAYAVIPTCDPGAPYYQEITVSHELAEAASDPLVLTAPAFANATYQNGWVGEIGDLCTQYDTGYQLADGGPYYVVQRIWSMAAADAGAQPCIPAPRPLYGNVSPDAGSAIQQTDESVFTANAGDSFVLTLTGWSNLPAVPFAVRAEPWGVGLFRASYGLGLSMDKSNLANGEEAHLTVTVPSDAPSGSYGIATIFSGFDDDNYAYWPIVVTVP
jgi:hypothetical protein